LAGEKCRTVAQSLNRPDFHRLARLAGSSPSLPSILICALVFALVFALWPAVSFSPPNWASTTAFSNPVRHFPEDSPGSSSSAPWRAIFEELRTSQIPDSVLSDACQNLVKSQPAAIVVDFYRDLPCRAGTRRATLAWLPSRRQS